MSYSNENSGFVGKNNRMREGKKDPEITGNATVAGVEYWVKGWKNAKGYGLRFEPKDGAKQARPQQQRSAQPPMDDDAIPF